MAAHDSSTSQVSFRNIIDTAAAKGSFHSLGKAVDAADLASVLRSSGPFTFLAPTDDVVAGHGAIHVVDSVIAPTRK